MKKHNIELLRKACNSIEEAKEAIDSVWDNEIYDSKNKELRTDVSGLIDNLDEVHNDLYDIINGVVEKKRLKKELLEALNDLKLIEEKNNSCFKVSETLESATYKLMDALENGVPEIAMPNSDKINQEIHSKVKYADRYLEQAKALLEEVEIDGYGVADSIRMIYDVQEELSDFSADLDASDEDDE